MSKFTNRPMSEYESATSAVIEVLASEYAKIGDRKTLLRRLLQQRDHFRLDGCTNAAATIDFVIRSIENAEPSIASDG